jgi:acyl transferase domain-containing protein
MEIESHLREHQMTYQRLPVRFAFHSHWIDAARLPFLSFMDSIRLRSPRIPLLCCEQATILTEVPADFFWRVVRRPIRFQDAIAHLERMGVHRYIDLGPAGTLATFLKYGMSAESASTVHPVLTPFGRDRANLDAVLALAR